MLAERGVAFGAPWALGAVLVVASALVFSVSLRLDALTQGGGNPEGGLVSKGGAPPSFI